MWAAVAPDASLPVKPFLNVTVGGFIEPFMM